MKNEYTLWIYIEKFVLNDRIQKLNEIFYRENVIE